MSMAVLVVNFFIVWLAERGRCDIIDNGSGHDYHVYQAGINLYAKYAAAYTLSQSGTFYDVTICNKILTQYTGNLQQV